MHTWLRLTSGTHWPGYTATVNDTVGIVGESLGALITMV